MLLHINNLLFSLLLNLTVVDYATIFVDEIATILYLGCFHYLAVTNSVGMKFLYISFRCKLLGVQLLGILTLKFKRRDKGQ